MKTIDLATQPLSVDQLLDSARRESIVLKAKDGETFVVSAADELSTEVELLRRNHRFLTLLDAFKQDTHTVSLDEVERRIRQCRGTVNLMSSISGFAFARPFRQAGSR